MTFQGIYVCRPEAAELREPGIDFLEWFRPQMVEAALRVHGGFHKTGFAKYAQVLGHAGLGHPKLTFNVSNGLLR